MTSQLVYGIGGICVGAAILIAINIVRFALIDWSYRKADDIRAGKGDEKC